jgi:hypothetical protein
MKISMYVNGMQERPIPLSLLEYKKPIINLYIKP